MYNYNDNDINKNSFMFLNILKNCVEIYNQNKYGFC